MPRDTIIDAATGGGAISLQFWLQSVNAVAQEVLLIGGAVLLTLRIALAIRAWRRRWPDIPADPDNIEPGSTP